MNITAEMAKEFAKQTQKYKNSVENFENNKVYQALHYLFYLIYLTSIDEKARTSVKIYEESFCFHFNTVMQNFDELAKLLLVNGFKLSKGVDYIDKWSPEAKFFLITW